MSMRPRTPCGNRSSVPPPSSAWRQCSTPLPPATMTPAYRVLEDGSIRPLYFYCVDVSEFAVNKLRDRGSLAVKTMVTNVQDFVVNVAKGLNL